jgi:hypothetical protein
VPVPSSPIPSATAVQYTVARLLECLSEFERWLGAPPLQVDFGGPQPDDEGWRCIAIERRKTKFGFLQLWKL